MVYNGLRYTCIPVYLSDCALFDECISQKNYSHFHNQINGDFIYNLKLRILELVIM